jgi:hypothetical protein
LANTERPSDWSKKTNPKKREPEQDLTTDVPAKCVKTNNNGSKKVVGRLDDDHLETVAVTKPSKQSKSFKLLEPSKPLKLEEKKRKQSDQQKLAESSRPAKCTKKTDSPTKTLPPMPAAPSK